MLFKVLMLILALCQQVDLSDVDVDHCQCRADFILEKYKKCFEPNAFRAVSAAPLFSETKEGENEFMCSEDFVKLVYYTFCLFIRYSLS